jgi:hypothetical protein
VDSVSEQSGKSNGFSGIKSISRRAVVPLIVLAWVGLLAGSFGYLMRYEATPALGTNPSATNSQFANFTHFSLVMGLHPHCPCSRATVEELAKILSRAPESVKLTVFAFKPKDEPDSWIEGSTVSSLKKFKARIVVDEEGTEAQRLGLATSGQVQVFSSAGVLLYNGGITAGRGHGGDNIGAQTVLELLRDGKSEGRSAPVFGCSIFEKSTAK